MKNCSRKSFLKFGERESLPASSRMRRKQIETALVDDALRRANVEQCADHRLARSSLGDGLLQLIDPPGDEREMRGILAGRLSRTAIRSLETDKCLQQG